MTAENPGLRHRPTQYVCPVCRLHLLTWDQGTDHIEMFHKVALWADFWTGKVRMICQYCLGATEILPEHLVDLLRTRYGLYAPKPVPPHKPTTEG